MGKDLEGNCLGLSEVLCRHLSRGVNKTAKEVTRFSPHGHTIVGTGNGTPEVPELPSAWGYIWATLSPGVINTER
jgi:hypothetical protein